MNPLFTLVLGLLIGWLIEWLIDYFYWRRRFGEDGSSSRMEKARVRRKAVAQEDESPPPAHVALDDLKVIKGVGPVIERKLNEAGIYTFEQLGNLSASGLRRILGNTIERLSDEESLLRQARDFARRKAGGA
jgi:predicted flap endonuclease-1-like 5' DNA nuclease